jgi:hypothetical protein
MNPLKYWTPEEFEISSYKFNLSTKINKTYKTSGSDNTGKCSYTYNSLGFRGDEPTKKGFKIMSIGDSNTEGVGVNDYETWSYQFTNMVPNGVNNNFGCGGRSNDFISRCLLTYYDLIKPDLVLIMYTSLHRREIHTENGGIEPFIPTAKWGYMEEIDRGKETHENLINLQNNNEDFVNWYKNHLLIKYFLETKKCNWLWNGFFDISPEYKEFNRFDGDYNRFIDKGVDGVHPGPKHNKSYAKLLHDYILLKFPNYIPYDGTKPAKLI